MNSNYNDTSLCYNLGTTSCVLQVVREMFLMEVGLVELLEVRL